jgi:hypothetical protein
VRLPRLAERLEAFVRAEKFALRSSRKLALGLPAFRASSVVARWPHGGGPGRGWRLA